MTKEQIAILGGGFGALTAAYYLSRTPELRERYEVTVHQMGWRLGGKCATGRDAEMRILEHGLHFWFGCYDNAWAMLREVYQHWERPPDCPFETGLDAFEAQSFTPLWTREGDGWAFYKVEWPTNSDQRGDGHVNLSLRGMLSEIVRLLKLVFEHGARASATAKAGFAEAPAAFFGPVTSRLGEALDAAHGVLSEGSGPLDQKTHARLAGHLDTVRESLADAAGAGAEGPDWAPIWRLVGEVLEIGMAFVRGVSWDILLWRKSLDALNAIEFRDWLHRHGASRKLLARSSAVKAIYDCCFWYVGGRHREPSVGTGTALRVILRIVATYKTAVMFTLKTGMAEAVVAPMYELMQARGVRFEFFHRVRRLEPDAAGDNVRRILIDRQARPIGGTYRPIRVWQGIPTWPAEPFWDQLEDGEALRAAGVNFESHWSPPYDVDEIELRRGRDFDKVILGISMGGYKPLNAQEPSLAQPLIDRGGPFAEMVEGIGLVPTMAAQVWLAETTHGLGWPDRPATVAGADPLDIWADMSLLGPHEGGGAGSVHYLCGAYGTELYRRPAGETGTPAAAAAEVAAALEAWITGPGAEAWPGRDAGQPVPPGNRYVRANIDPTECCVGSSAGEVAKRLHTDESGFDNLFLAGCYTRTGLNTTCVESAVMSGMQAARAISGSPERVLGENFVLHDEEN